MIQEAIDEIPKVGHVSYLKNKQGIFVDTGAFKETSNHWMKTGKYCNELWGTPDWKDFWIAEKKKIMFGHTISGVTITGEHYNYLNYCPIQKSEDLGGGIGRKVKGFPDFWDGDYNYFWIREIARNGILKNHPNLTPKERVDIYYMEPVAREKELVRLVEELNLMYDILPSKTVEGIRTDYLLGGHDVIVLKSRRKGFEQPNSETVMTPDGPTTMGQLKVGDSVLTRNGTATVQEYYPQGLKDVYEITLQDGRTVRAGKDHLWKIIEFRGYEKIVNTEFFLDKKLKRGAKGKEYYGYYLPQNEEVEYPKKDLKIHPYILGSLIGDGSMTKGSTLFSTADKESLDKIKNLLGKDYSINHKAGYQYSIVHNKDHTNPIGAELRRLGLRCNARDKFIPEDYKYSSIEDRYELIRGLMDTDGTSSPNSSARFTNTSEKLVDDLAYVCRSLGIRVSKSTADTRGYLSSFSKSVCYILSISTDKEIFSLERKQANIRKKKYNTKKIAIVSVKKLDYQEESSCILIDSPEHLYLTKDYIVTHNSFKNAAVGARNFQHMPTSYTMLMAYEKKYLYPKGIFNMTMNYINFVNEHTAFRMPSDYVRKQDHIRNSYKTYEDGVEIEKGFMSEVQAISFKDNPQAGVGKDCLDILGEEVGSWGTPGGLKDTVASMLPSVTDGDLRTGMMTLFGTANDISKGTVDFANMFENVEMHTFLPFRDIWNDPNKVEGFFFPAQLNMISHYDSDGNSNLQTATSAELLTRRKKELAGASATLLNKRKREFPLNSAEALSSISFNDLPVEELKQRLTYVKKHSVNTVVGTPVTFYYEDGKIHAKPVLDGSHEPIHSYFDLPENLDGCAVIYEPPSPLAQRGLYKIGYDPVEQENGTSLAAIIVYKAVQFGAVTHSCIVAEYIGRFSDPDDIDLMAEMLADYYNAQVMHENMFRSTITYFRRKGRLAKLAYQPNSVISASVKSSKVDRVYGCHMSTALKADGLKYIKTWLLTPVNYLEDGRIIRVLDTINSRRLLEELINYNNKGNFDLISALIMALFMVQEERLGKVHQNLDEAGASKKAKYDKLRGLMNNNRL